MEKQAYTCPIEKFQGRTFSPQELDIKIVEEVIVAGKSIHPASPPKGFVQYDHIGIMAHEACRTQLIHAWPIPYGFSEPQRACITPNDDFLLGCAVGEAHQFGKDYKVNDIVLYRSKDRGHTWTGPTLAWDVPYNQHAFNPFVDKKNNCIYSFGTEFRPDLLVLPHNGGIPMRVSKDDGYTWSEPTILAPVNDPNYRGVGHMQGCITSRGTWLLGTYFIRSKPGGRADRQFILRSEDWGDSWQLLPDKCPNGWYLPEYDRILEGVPIDLGNDEIVFFVRTEEGHIWELRSFDDGKTWSDPQATELVHPDSPPMIFKLADNQTLIAFIHNKPAAKLWLNGAVRNELWVSTSTDKGHHWSEPRFLAVNTHEPVYTANGFVSVGGVEVCYADLLVDGDKLHLFFDHRKRTVVQLQFTVQDIETFPTSGELK